MKAFLQATKEKVWLAVEVGWKKPSDHPTTWDDGKIKDANFNSRALNALFSDVISESSRKYHRLKLLRKHGPFFETTYKGTKIVKTIKL